MSPDTLLEVYFIQGSFMSRDGCHVCVAVFLSVIILIIFFINSRLTAIESWRPQRHLWIDWAIIPLLGQGGHARLSASWLCSTVIIHHFPRKLINTNVRREYSRRHSSTFVRLYRSRLNRSRSRLILTASYTREKFDKSMIGAIVLKSFRHIYVNAVVRKVKRNFLQIDL